MKTPELWQVSIIYIVVPTIFRLLYHYATSDEKIKKEKIDEILNHMMGVVGVTILYYISILYQITK